VLGERRRLRAAMPVNGPVNGVACGVVGRPADGGRDLRVPASIPCYSHHRGSKFNARSRRRPAAPSAPQACSLQAPYGFPSEGFHSGGPKHSQGLKLSKLPKWRTVPYDTDSREAKVHRKTGAPLRSWDRVSWEHAALDLRHHRRRALQPQRSLTDRRNLAREAAWNGAHAVTVSEKNSAVPRSCRSYFRDPKELGLNGTIMGTRPSGVWKTLRRPGSQSIEDRVAVGGLSLYGRDVVAVPGSLERPSTGHSVVSAGAVRRMDEFRKRSPKRRPRTAPNPSGMGSPGGSLGGSSITSSASHFLQVYLDEK